jgi:hypothetical protein
VTFRQAIAPPAEVSKVDTGLRFTDILFGFVIRELFLRLQNWSALPVVVRWQLVTGAALVLGSWIGFRRSVNRPSYEIKFFNLPFFRFGLDQLMIILYFRIAVITDEPYKPVSADRIAHETIKTLVYVYFLYLAWDALGVWMARVKEDGIEKYPKVVDGRPDRTTPSRQDWPGIAITGICLAVIGLLLLLLNHHSFSAAVGLAGATAVLVLYRLGKDVKNTWLA